MNESFWVLISDITQPIEWKTIFSEQKEIHIDLGAGDGGFAIGLAQKNPQWNVLAVERLKGRAQKIVRKAKQQNLKNLRVLRLESSYFLTYLVPTSSVSMIHVMHPDPWPKRKQHKNRLFQKNFIESCLRVLIPGGKLRFTSDHPSYFIKVLKIVKEFHGLHMEDWNHKFNYPKSDFEKRFSFEEKIVMQQVWKKI